jgi:adenylate kinase family enzyme
VSVPVERIAIIGCGGSGKSHLARVLGTRLGITPVHLDALYYHEDAARRFGEYLLSPEEQAG